MRRWLEWLAAAAALVVFVACVAPRAWGAPGYDLSALVVGARMVETDHVDRLYDHHPTFYNLADAPEFRQAASELGFDAYAPTPFVHPPIVAVAAEPLTHVRFTTLVDAWLVVSVAAMVASLWLALRVYAPQARPIHFAVLLLALAPFEPIRYGLWLAQTTPIVFLTMLGALALSRRGHDAWAGALLALPVFLKLTPVALAGVWLVHRRWRALAFLGVGVLALTIASVASVGLHANVEYLRRVSQISSITLVAYNNHSAVAALTRLGGGGPSPELFTMVTPPIWAKSAVAIGTLLVAFALFAALRGRTFSRDSAPLLEACAMLAMLLVPTIAWTHYFVLLVPVAIAVVALAPARLRWAAVAGAALCLAPCMRPLMTDFTAFDPRHPGWLAGPTVSALLALALSAVVGVSWRRGVV